MKRTLFIRWCVGLVLSSLPLAGGCIQKTQTTQILPAKPAPVPVYVAPAPAPSAPGIAAPNSVQAPVAAAAPAAAETVPAPGVADLRISPALAEVVRLAQSGVEQSVVLNFVTNSTGYYNLGADQIVYLKDLGFESEVINLMMQHDRDVMARLNAQQAAEAAAQANAASTAAPLVVQQAVPAPEVAPVPATVTYFQEDLAPYGSWIYLDSTYGWCWRPTVAVVNVGWRPYCQGGRWLYSDCGWYWQSDYSWGGTAFHYGRWYNHPRHGWCWWPDTCWGPSWVTWRTSDDYCGWAPMPPRSGWRVGVGFTYCDAAVNIGFGFNLSSSCYSFVPWNRFCDPRPYRYCAPPHQMPVVYNRTVVVNNFINGNNNVVINNGIPVGRVNRAMGHEVRQVAIRDNPMPGGPARGHADRVRMEGNRPVIMRSTPPALAHASDPHAGVSPRGNGNPGRSPTIDRPPASPAQPRMSATSPNNSAPSRIDSPDRRSGQPSARTSMERTPSRGKDPASVAAPPERTSAGKLSMTDNHFNQPPRDQTPPDMRRGATRDGTSEGSRTVGTQPAVPSSSVGVPASNLRSPGYQTPVRSPRAEPIFSQSSVVDTARSGSDTRPATLDLNGRAPGGASRSTTADAAPASQPRAYTAPSAPTRPVSSASSRQMAPSAMTTPSAPARSAAVPSSTPPVASGRLSDSTPGQAQQSPPTRLVLQQRTITPPVMGSGPGTPTRSTEYSTRSASRPTTTVAPSTYRAPSSSPQVMSTPSAPTSPRSYSTPSVTPSMSPSAAPVRSYSPPSVPSQPRSYSAPTPSPSSSPAMSSAPSRSSTPPAASSSRPEAPSRSSSSSSSSGSTDGGGSRAPGRPGR